MTDTGYYDTSYPPYLWADPSIASLTPNTGVVNGGPYSVTVTGADFYDGSRVEINQSVVPTTYVSPTQLRVSHSPTVVGTDEFTVRNGAGSGGEESNSVMFTVTATSEEPEPEEPLPPPPPESPEEPPGDPLADDEPSTE
jgi:hypothetical protein